MVARRTRKAKKEERCDEWKAWPRDSRGRRGTSEDAGGRLARRGTTRKRHRRQRRCDEDEASRTEQQSATRPASAIPGEHERGHVADEGRSIVPGKREKDERQRRRRRRRRWRRQSAKERTPLGRRSEREHTQASTRGQQTRRGTTGCGSKTRRDHSCRSIPKEQPRRTSRTAAGKQQVARGSAGRVLPRPGMCRDPAEKFHADSRDTRVTTRPTKLANTSERTRGTRRTTRDLASERLPSDTCSNYVYVRYIDCWEIHVWRSLRVSCFLNKIARSEWVSCATIRVCFCNYLNTFWWTQSCRNVAYKG